MCECKCHREHLTSKNLVDRLRRGAEGYGHNLSVMREAAAELDRLAADTDRLRDALQLIADQAICPELFPEETNSDRLCVKTAVAIARVALGVVAIKAGE